MCGSEEPDVCNSSADLRVVLKKEIYECFAEAAGNIRQSKQVQSRRHCDTRDAQVGEAGRDKQSRTHWKSSVSACLGDTDCYICTSRVLLLFGAHIRLEARYINTLAHLYSPCKINLIEDEKSAIFAKHVARSRVWIYDQSVLVTSNHCLLRLKENFLFCGVTSWKCCWRASCKSGLTWCNAPCSFHHSETV